MLKTPLTCPDCILVKLNSYPVFLFVNAQCFLSSGGSFTVTGSTLCDIIAFALSVVGALAPFFHSFAGGVTAIGSILSDIIVVTLSVIDAFAPFTT